MAHKLVNNFELYYNTLLAIFPEIDSKFIEEACRNPPFDAKDQRSEDDYLHMFIDYLCGFSDILEESQRLERLRLSEPSTGTLAPVECQCCYEEFECTAAEVKCKENHVFCKSCVVKGTQLAISNGESSVKCFMGCNDEIGLPTLRRILPRKTWDALMRKRQEAEIAAAKLSNLECCPFCPYQMEIDDRDVTTFYCQNPECMKVTCRLCKRKYHYDVKCDNVLDEHKGRLLVEEEMSKALIRSCYRCKKPFVIRDGCNKIKCPCGALMCYQCRRPISGYEHFSKPGGCPLYADWKTMDRIQVEQRRRETISKIRQDFPDLNIPKI